MKSTTVSGGKLEFFLNAMLGMGFSELGSLDIKSGKALEWLREHPETKFFWINASRAFSGSAYRPGGYVEVSIPEFLAEVAQAKLDKIPDTITIKLNSEYSAEVGEKTTTVGCQVFDNAVILKVAEAIKGK